MLKVRNLKINTGGDIVVNVLNNVNFEVLNNSIVLIEGENGAGKSTLLKSIVNYFDIQKDGGEIIFNNKNIMSMSVDEIMREGIHLCAQSVPHIEGLSNLKLLYKAYTNNKKENTKNILEFKKYLEELCDKYNFKKELIIKDVGGDMSGGEKKMMQLLSAIVLNPELLLLDEIDSGVDKNTVINFYKIINELKNKMSIIIVSHNSNIKDFIDFDKIYKIENKNLLEI